MKFKLDSLWENSPYKGVTIPGLCTIALSGLRMNRDNEYAFIKIKGKKTLCQWDTKGADLSISIDFAKLNLLKDLPIDLRESSVDLNGITLKIKLIDPTITSSMLNGIPFIGEINHVIDSINPLTLNITKAEKAIEDYPTQFLDYPEDLTHHLLQELEIEAPKLNLAELESILTYEISRRPEKEDVPPIPLTQYNLSIIRREPLLLEALRYCGQYIEEELERILKYKGLLEENDTFALFKRDSNNQILIAKTSDALAIHNKKTALHLSFENIDYVMESQDESQGYISTESYYRSASPVTFITECFLDFILEKYKPGYIRRYKLNKPYTIEGNNTSLVKNRIIRDRFVLFHELNHVFSGGGSTGMLGHGDFPTGTSLAYKNTMVELRNGVTDSALTGPSIYAHDLFYPYISAFNIIKDHRIRRIDKSVKYPCKLRELICIPDNTIDPETGKRYKFILSGQFYKENDSQAFPVFINALYDIPHGGGYHKSFFTTMIKPDGSFKLSLPYMIFGGDANNPNNQVRELNLVFTFLTTSSKTTSGRIKIPLNGIISDSEIDQKYRDSCQSLLTEFNNNTQPLYKPNFDLSQVVPPLFPSEEDITNSWA